MGRGLKVKERTGCRGEAGVRGGEEELGGAVRYTTWYAVTLRRGYAAVSGPRRGAVCHAVVLPADIFIGDRATCNRLRGIRTERCFAHLYPRFAARPIQRQPSLSVLALSRFSSPPPSLSHLSFTLSLFFLSSASAINAALKRRGLFFPTLSSGDRGDDILAHQPPRRSSLCYNLRVQ